MLDRAHTPDQPDWRILSVQGAVLDQMGRHEEAQRYYASALKIVPDEPSVLSNLGLSYALSKDLRAGRGDAAARRRAGAAPTGACGRTSRWWSACRAASQEAETIARADLPPDEAAANVAYLRADAGAAERLKTLSKAARAGAQRSTGASGSKPLNGAVAGRADRRARAAASTLGCIADDCVLDRHHPDRGRAQNDDEQHRQEEQDHRHGELGRQRGGLLLGFRHAHVAVLLRHHAQRLAERRAVALRLLQRHADRLHAVEIGALGEILVGLRRSCR